MTTAEITTKSTSRCVYDGRPSVTIRTGQKGNRFGLCAECGPEHEKSLVAEAAIAELEECRTKLRGLGPLSPRAEKFFDDMALLISVTRDPQRALGTVFRVLAGEPVEVQA